MVTGGQDTWLAGIALASPGINFVALPGFPNPFSLHEDEECDVVLVADWAFAELSSSDLRYLDSRAPLVGLDSADTVALAFPPDAMERLTLVIKVQGLYRDRELYNYFVGPQTPNANWTDKVVPRPQRYRNADLEKLRLSVPCFAFDLPAVRRAMRALEARTKRSLGRPMLWPERTVRNAVDDILTLALRLPRRRRYEIHRVFSLSHPQRLEVLQRLNGFTGKAGITHVMPGVGEAVSEAALTPQLRRRENRLRFLTDMHRHKIVVAPTGIGELTFRHAEAWRTGAALVSQDLNHVETMFPLREGENVVYCRPDLSDLGEVARGLLSDDGTRERIAAAGRQDYRAWTASWRRLLIDGLERHLEEATGRSPAAPMPHTAAARP